MTRPFLGQGDSPGSAPLSWVPVRHGKIYCAPGCGAGCTWAAYQRAEREARALARRLGKGWRPVVFENKGWSLHVVSPCKRIGVSPNRNVTGPHSYSALFGDRDDHGTAGLWFGRGATPEAAALAVIKIVKAATVNLPRIKPHRAARAGRKG